MIDLGNFGLRKDEGEEWPIEQPTLISQALSLLQDRMTLEGFASEMTINTSELRSLLGSCVPQEILDKMSLKIDEGQVKIVFFRPPE